MNSRRWFCACASAIFLFVSAPAIARAQGNGHGHGNGHDKGKHADNGGRGEHGDRGDHFYRDRDRVELRGWYHDHYNQLPPGLAKRDRLPPGLERQLVVRGTLPPGLRKKIYPCPPEVVRFLPPPPPDCEHVIIGGNIVLVNRHTWLVVDIFHFEL